MIPIYILQKDVELPAKGTYYIVTRNGVFLHKDTPLIEATVRVNGIPFLNEVTPKAHLRLPKLPPKLAVQALLFFRRVYQQYQSEAALLLHYSTETQQYVLHCPSQKVGPGSVKYDMSERFANFQLVGTIHSHARMSAFHSGIDHEDERHFDGLHITIGDMHQPYFTISCSAMVNNQRFHLVSQDAIAGITPVTWQPLPRLSYRRRTVTHSKPIDFFNLDWLKFDDAFEQLPLIQEPEFYDMALPDGQDYRHVSVPKPWLGKVTNTSWIDHFPITQVISNMFTPDNQPTKKGKQ